MSTFRNPVGPQPTGVYWRRRLLVLVALLAAVVIALSVISAITSGASKGAAPVGNGTSPAVTGGTTPADTGVAGAACTPASIKIAAVTDKTAYAAGESPKLSFNITNTGKVACTYNVGSTQQTYAISSGAEKYWSSKDCETGPVDTPLLLQPNEPMTSGAITWDRTRSSTTTCTTTRPAVSAGGATYNLTVTVGAAKSETPKAFILN